MNGTRIKPRESSVSDVLVTESSIVSVAKHVASAAAPDGSETVIVDPVSGTYFGVSDYGVRVWALIQQPRRVGDVRDMLLEEYEVAPEVLMADMQSLISELAQAGLVNVVQEP